MAIRTRIAPSPTGDPHVGTAYTALFNKTFAEAQQGRFVLRIEDTDQARSTAESEQAIVDALRWMGLDWDEGPDVGGDFGPYRQSQRLGLYRESADALLAAGDAFLCFCSAERLDAMRREQRAKGETTRYDGHCLSLDPEQARARADAGEAHVVRLKVPADGVCRFEDALRGPVEIPWRQIDSQVLVKSDGFPTYHLAVVVDDHHMAISHVLRGEEWLNSMPKHQLLYQALGWAMPVHYHLPLLRNPDGSKLSKRRNPTGLDYYRRSGYLPEALRNYLALMGWSMPDERELFSAEEMTRSFDAGRIHAGGPVFDLKKLAWMNGQYIRAMRPEALMQRVSEWALDRARLALLVPLLQQRTERLIDVVPQVDYLLGERPEVTEQSLVEGTPGAEHCKRILDHAGRRLEELRSWQRESIHDALRALAEAMGLRLRDFLPPLFVAVSGRRVALPLFDSMAYLGRDLVRARLRSAIDALGGIGKKEAKRLDRAYRSLAEPAAEGGGSSP